MDVVFNLAAENHVDTSILNANTFTQKNIVSTYQQLQRLLVTTRNTT
ncbi:hypothetical protein FCV55_15955 [Vibrio sp. F13]|nr:hypothetical protein FCV55_15955 [Vibrio sp. F13]